MAQVGKELGVFTAGNAVKHNGCTVMYGAEGMIWSKKAYFALCLSASKSDWQMMPTTMP